MDKLDSLCRSVEYRLRIAPARHVLRRLIARKYRLALR